MESTTRSGMSVAAQMNLLMGICAVIPAAVILGVGAWVAGQLSATGATSQTNVWIVALPAAIVIIVIVALAAYRMRVATRGRLQELIEVCRQASMGSRNARATVQGDDEYALLGAAINAVLEGTPSMGGGAKTIAADSPEAAILQAQIEKLLQEVSAVGDGDLRVQAEVTPDTLGVLADSFNYMIEELAKVVGRVQATTLQVTNATRRLLDRSAEVAHASEGQALQISQTSDAVARLADFVQLSATNALHAAEAAREALTNAEAGQQAVVQTIDGMVHIRENVQDTSKKIKRLGERSQEVGEIVRLIEDIADQTNLLALNAAIQSAMAGEHGRGFAVVADEIRVLAERVTEATKKIATIVKTIQGDTYDAVVAMEESTQEVVNGSRLADEAGKSLLSIYGAVQRQTQIVQDIASAAGDRKQTAEAVAVAMNQIAAITQQTNTATQDTTTSVSYLAELAEQLRASVATFRLPDQIAEAAGLLPESAPVLPGGMTGSIGGIAGVPRIGAPVGLPYGGGTSYGTPEWGGEAMPALPALPAGSMGMGSGMGAMGQGGYDADPFAAPLPDFMTQGAMGQGASAYATGYAPDFGQGFGQAPAQNAEQGFGQPPMQGYGQPPMQGYGQGNSSPLARPDQDPYGDQSYNSGPFGGVPLPPERY